ncbi:MAG: FecR domain-containing protein, partial [Thermodesulfobacteriota bacterium]
TTHMASHPKQFYIPYHKLKTFFFAALFFLLLSVVLCPAVGSAESLRSWSRARTKEVQSRVVALGKREARAKERLGKSRETLRQARVLDDATGAALLGVAITSSLRTLDALRDGIEREEALIDDIERNMIDGRHMGYVGKIKGRLFKFSNRRWVPFDGRSLITAGEQYKVGSGGYLDIAFSEGSGITLGPLSRLKVEKLSDRRSIFILKAGRVRVLVSRDDQERKRRYLINGIIVRTHLAEFSIVAGEDKTTELHLLGGSASIASNAGNAEMVLRRGERVIILSDGSIKGPVLFNLKKYEPWWPN